MNVLLVRKTTNFELHGQAVQQQVERGLAPEMSMERLKAAHEEHNRTLQVLRRSMKDSGWSFREITRDDPWPDGAVDLVVTVGGDGTLLWACQHMYQGGRAIGVRSSGSSVGYLCGLGSEQIEAIGERYARISFATLSRLYAQIDHADGRKTATSPVLNDFLFANVSPAATTRYQLGFGDSLEDHRSSGVWIATAAGSTAAILAAGGEERPRTETLFQYRVREAYFKGHHQPRYIGGLFDPDQEPLIIENRCQQAMLAVDGQHGSIDLAYGDKMRFLRALPIEVGTTSD